MSDACWMAVGWWRRYDEWKLLPYPGDIADQPNYVIEAFTLCEAERGKLQRQEQDRQQKQMKTLGR